MKRVTDDRVFFPYKKQKKNATPFSYSQWRWQTLGRLFMLLPVLNQGDEWPRELANCVMMDVLRLHFTRQTMIYRQYSLVPDFEGALFLIDGVVTVHDMILDALAVTDTYLDADRIDISYVNCDVQERLPNGGLDVGCEWSADLLCDQDLIRPLEWSTPTHHRLSIEYSAGYEWFDVAEVSFDEES